jgi:N6-L-threonylcarbamoyladenine synthase
VVASQAELHAGYGGVVPEIASRRHLELVAPVVRAALDDAGTSLDDVGRVAVTQGPGLVGALLVGLSAAKAIAWARGLPLVPIDHLRAHVATLYLRPDPLEPPFTCLLASGGHTLLLSIADRAGFEVLGATLDDAAGEAFDKGARLLGLGYPGGAELDRLAHDGDPEAFAFPVARVAGLDFSFSGLKTSLLYAVRDLDQAELERRRADLAASYQRAIVRALVGRLAVAAEQTGHERVAVVGGVAANSELRASLPDARFAPLALCTDNAAMVASAGRFAAPVPLPGYLGLDAYASSPSL